MKFSNDRILLLILVFTFVSRAVFAPTPYGWNEEVYIKSIREFYEDPTWLLDLDEPPITFVAGPIFYILHVPYYQLAMFLGLSTNFVLHMFSALLGTVLVLLCYILGRTMFDEKTGLIFSSLISVFPVTWMISRHVTSENLSLVFVLMSFITFYQSREEKSKRAHLFSSFLMALAFLSRYDVIVLLPFFLALPILIDRPLNLKRTVKEFLLFALIFGLTVSPFIVFSMLEFGMPIPTPQWMMIVSTMIEGTVSFDYFYSFSDIFSTFGFYLFCFSLPFIPIFVRDFENYFRKIGDRKVLLIAFIVPPLLFGLNPNFVQRPSLADFGFDQSLANIGNILFVLSGYFVFVYLFVSMLLGENETKFLSIWTLAFFFLWFLLVREWQIQIRYLVISTFPILLLGAKKAHQKLGRFLIVAGFSIFLVVGLLVNLWASASWGAMFETMNYLEEISESGDEVLIYSTHGYYDTVYFDDPKFVSIRPYVYSRWDSYRTSIKYVVYDTANYYLVNSEIRDFLETRPDLLEKVVDVKITLLLYELQVDTIKIYKTEGLVLPEASDVNYVSDYFI
jgi:4-amino-4-deoxy-L-arabinose transferase-like glycosyltransferase